MRVGYGRVSTQDQNPQAQRDALQAGRCDEILIDATSGTLARRPELDKALLSANRAGDQLVVTKLDRLGRSLEHLIELAKLLQTRGVDLLVLDQGEHALMSELTIDGLMAARARGRTGGQKPNSARARSSWRARRTTRPTRRQALPHGRADRRRVRRQPTPHLPAPNEDPRHRPQVVPDAAATAPGRDARATRRDYELRVVRWAR